MTGKPSWVLEKALTVKIDLEIGDIKLLTKQKGHVTFWNESQGNLKITKLSLKKHC